MQKDFRKISGMVFGSSIIVVVAALVFFQAIFIVRATVQNEFSVINLFKQTVFAQKMEKESPAVPLAPAPEQPVRAACPELSAITPASVSLVDYLTEKGIYSTFEQREMFARARGLDTYSGTQRQNSLLLRMLIQEDSCE